MHFQLQQRSDYRGDVRVNRSPFHQRSRRFQSRFTELPGAALEAMGDTRGLRMIDLRHRLPEPKQQGLAVRQEQTLQTRCTQWVLFIERHQDRRGRRRAR